MLRIRLSGLALVGLATSLAGCGTVDVARAEDEKPAAAAPKETGKNVAENAPEVAFPDLPKGAARQTVEVHYHGWLDNKSVFDSSYGGKTITFPLNQVIPGWTEGMQLVGKGGMIELEIPAKLGYGSRGAGAAVPPNATLHFLVELKDIK